MPDHKEFVVTVTIKVPINKHANVHANERDVRYYLEGAITEYAPKLREDHPLRNLEDDDISVTRVIAAQG